MRVRIGSIAKLLMGLPNSMATMGATQWLERTLDDSALRRVVIPQAFMAADALLLLARNVGDGLQVHDAVIGKRVMEHLPFIASEELLMQGVDAGGDRQELHERLRRVSWEAAETLRGGASHNPLRELIEKDSELAPILASLPPWDPQRFVGLAPLQTQRYLEDVVSNLPVPEDDGLTDLSV